MSPDDLIIRSGYVVTMDPELGDLPDGDVLVTGGRIAAVGAGLGAGGARELDARGMIVAPGLVNTHWHMWNTLLRSMSAVRRGRTARPGTSGDDRARAARSPTTTSTRAPCWPAPRPSTPASPRCTTGAHNLRGPAHAEAELRALAAGRAAGPVLLRVLGRAPQRRGRWTSPGCARCTGTGTARGRAGGRLTLGMACRGPGGSNPAMRVPRRGLPAGDRRRPRAGPAGHRARVRAAARRRADRRAGRGGPARAGPAGGARQLRDPGGDRPARRGRVRGEPVAVQRAADRLRAAADGGAARGRASGSACRWTPRR